MIRIRAMKSCLFNKMSLNLSWLSKKKLNYEELTDRELIDRIYGEYLWSLSCCINVYCI